MTIGKFLIGNLIGGCDFKEYGSLLLIINILINQLKKEGRIIEKHI
jgi:hypothetical protein